MNNIRVIDGVIVVLFCAVACSEVPEVPTPPASPTPTPVQTPDPEIGNPLCDSKFKPGEQPFVWKPKSENPQFFCNPPRRTAVVLLPSRFINAFDSVSIGDEDATFTGFSNGWPEGQNERQTWRFCRPGSAYGKGFEVVAREEGQECTYKIKNGARRQVGE